MIILQTRLEYYKKYFKKIGFKITFQNKYWFGKLDSEPNVHGKNENSEGLKKKGGPKEKFLQTCFNSWA
jgi:hypothetical protein